jgi:hypothetical protein
MPFITQGKTNWKFLLIVIILAVIVGARTFWLSKEIKTEESITPISPVLTKKALTPEQISERKSECQNIKDYVAQTECYANLAIDTNDPSLCPEFGLYICRYFTFMKNTNLCSDIPTEKITFKYLDNDAVLKSLKKKQECIKKIAIDTKNIELCENLFDQASDCQEAIALELNDPSKCSDYGDCVMKIAIKKKDINICKSKYDKAWCTVEFPKLLQGKSQCYGPPVGIEVFYGEEGIDGKYIYPNIYDDGSNDYPTEIAPESEFYHLLSIPFNNRENLLRVYTSKNSYNMETISFLRLIKYSISSKTSELLGDIRSETGGNWGGIYIPIAISKDDKHIIFKAKMGLPGAGGGSVDMGYAFLSLSSKEYDECGYLTPKKIAEQVYFYDNFSKGLFLTEEKNVPASIKPGPSYNSAIKFINFTTGEIKTLFQEPNTIYEIINLDEKLGAVNFKSCQWQEFRFSCPAGDPSIKIRSMNLP